MTLFQPTKVLVDGMRDDSGLIEYWGMATLQPNGFYRCNANVAGCWAVVEVSIYFDLGIDNAFQTR